MHFTRSNFNWAPVLFISSYHLILLIALPFYFLHFVPSVSILITSFVLLYLTGLSVTAGYHRLYSHQTYKTNRIVEGVLLFFASMASQGSALGWAFEHRHHHAFVDTDKDPYSIKKGFWYAHFLWLLKKPKPIDEKIVSDLMRNPLLRFQHRYYPYLMFITNVLAFLFVGWCFNDYLGSFLFAWLVRLFFLHHFTWFINSLAHTWGARHFCKELSAVDNYLISLVTFGEGYHNYHHTFAYDYRNGIRWYHFDPTKWLIWTLSKFGWARQLKRVHSLRVKEKIILDRKRLLLEKIPSSLATQKTEWEKKIITLTESILAKMGHLKELKEAYKLLKKSQEGTKEHLLELKIQIKNVSKFLRQEYRQSIAYTRYFATFKSS